MHRQTTLTAGFVGYTSGGVRSLVDEINDKTGMQEMKGTMLFEEMREKIESPQNYGFTSVVMKADKKNGKIEECAEAYINYLGGNRSFPVCTVMDDRRYRLKELKPGDVAFYDHQQQQFHMNEKGTFLTGINDKKIRFALHEVEKEQEGGGGGSGVATLAEGGGSSSGQGGQQKKKGQKQRYEKAEEKSKRFMDLNKDNINVAHDANINVKAAKVLNLEGSEKINYKTATHTFDGDVVIKGELRVKKDIKTDAQGFKPTGPEWAPGSAGVSLTAEQQALWDHKIRIEPNGDIVIDGDFSVTGNLTVNGVVRAKGFETVDA